MVAKDFWTVAGFGAATGGRLVLPVVPQGGDCAGRNTDDNAIIITGVSIDSRTIDPGEAFVAIAGEQFDGHRFVGDAVKGGASLVVVSDEDAIDCGREAKVPALVVEDTVESLGNLARVWRGELMEAGKVTVIGITGSCGKTTTKGFLDSILSTIMNGCVSPKSFNNSIGVPLTILSTKLSDRYLLSEIGTNGPGEVAELGGIVRPDIAVITNVGRSHLEGLGSVEGVAREKATLLRTVLKGGCAILPTRDACGSGLDVMEFVEDEGEEALGDLRVVRFGESADADVRVVACEAEGEGMSFELGDGTQWSIGAQGKHHVLDAAAAIAVAWEMGVDDGDIWRGLKVAKLPAMRMEEAVTGGGVRIFNDAYNANPESMRASIETFTGENGGMMRKGGDGRRIVVLGEMLELGAESRSCHEEIVDLVSGLIDDERIDVAYFVGEGFFEVRDRGRSGMVLKESAEMVFEGAADGSVLVRIADVLRAGDCVLLKGSRRVGLERLVEVLRG